MIIDRIRLINFLSHEDSEIYFDTGVNVIVGHNGAGKSSIIDAIRFALFGDRRTKKIEDMIRKGAKSMEVEMEFRNAGHKYIIRRSVTRRSKNPESNAMIMVDGNALSQSVKDANDYIEKNIITKGKDVFLNSIFSKQGEMDDLISGDPARRKQLLDEILEIDRLEETYVMLKDVIDSMQRSISNLDYLVSDNDRDKQDLERYRNDISEISKLIERDQNAEAELSKKEMEARTRYEELKSQITTFNTKLDTMRSYLDEAARNENEIKSIEKKLQEISRSMQRYGEITSSEVYLNRDRIRAYWIDKGQLQEYMKSLSRLDDQIKTYEDSMKLASELEAQHEEYERKRVRLDEIKHELDDLRQYESKYGSFSLGLQQKVETLNDYSRKKESLGAEISRIVGKPFSSTGELQAIYDDVRKRLDNVTEVQGDLKVRMGTMKQQENEIRRNMGLLGGHNTCPVCGTDLGEKGSRDLLDHYSEEIKRLDNEMKKIEEEISKYEDEKKTLRSLETYLASGKIREYSSLENQIMDLEKKIGEDRDSLSSLEEKHQRYVQLDQEYRSIDLDDLRKKDEKWRNAKATVEAIGDIDALKRDRDDLLQKIRETQGRTEEMESKFGDINSYTPSYISGLEDEARSLEAEVRKADELGRQKDTLLNKIQELRARSAGMDAIERQRKEAEENLNVAGQQLNGITAQIKKTIESISGNRSKADTIRSRMNELEEKIRERDQEIERMRRIEKAIDSMRKIREAFSKNGVPALIRQSVSEYLTSKTRDYLSSFELDFDDVSIDQDFNVTIYRGGIPEGIDSLSGGERTAVAFAIRVAVAQFLNTDLSLLILDEPTAFLDEERRNSLSNIIEYTLKDSSIIPQVIIISHHRELLSSANVAIEVKKVGGKSVVINAD
ncbi:DNA double-strand break repair ATPase Rad50 [Thermoplasma sp.]|uniref:DNA double-strand break repair ATPase Rad50 n=1 Tax=Thermoplasma sp. TaxID=1973142 RepID=UPI00126EB13A|nr:DNA double-strand break repair ATPase Rad50 [Thermoplasma sp.]KAA8922673.1 MAG: DNA double-strand break repair ATPase Rad50 [Thermoplasma sp.]